VAIRVRAILWPHRNIAISMTPFADRSASRVWRPSAADRRGVDHGVASGIAARCHLFGPRIECRAVGAECRADSGSGSSGPVRSTLRKGCHRGVAESSLSSLHRVPPALAPGRAAGAGVQRDRSRSASLPWRQLRKHHSACSTAPILRIRPRRCVSASVAFKNARGRSREPRADRHPFTPSFFPAPRYRWIFPPSPPMTLTGTFTAPTIARTSASVRNPWRIDNVRPAAS